MTIYGHYDAHEGQLLQRLAALTDPPGLVVEVGSFFGRSTCFLGLGAQASGRKVIAVDHGRSSPEMRGGWWHTPEGTTPALRENLQAAGLEETVQVLPVSSPEVFEDWDRGLIAVFHLDGQHDEVSVRRDLEAVWPHLTEDAILAIHDFYGPDWPGVQAGVAAAYPDWFHFVLGRAGRVLALLAKPTAERLKKMKEQQEEATRDLAKCPVCGLPEAGRCECASAHAACINDHVWDILTGDYIPEAHRRVKIIIDDTVILTGEE